MGDLEIMAVEGRAFVGAEEDAGLRDVLREREHALRLGAGFGAIERHHAHVEVGGAVGGLALQLVHGGEDAADAGALDGAGEEEVHADAARPELEAEFAAEGVHRGLGDDIGGATVIGGAGEDGGDVHHRAAGAHVGGGCTGDVPDDTEDVADGVGDGLAVGGAGLLQGEEVGLGEGDILQQLLGACGAGVVDQDVDVAEALHDVGDAGADAFRVCAVEGGGCHLVWRCAGFGQDRLAGGLCPVGRAARHDDDRAFADIVAHDLGAEVAGSACDDGDLAGEAAGGGRQGDGGGGGAGLGRRRHVRRLQWFRWQPSIRGGRRGCAGPWPAARG